MKSFVPPIIFNYFNLHYISNSFATVFLSKKLERIDELFLKNYLFLVKPFKTYRYNINLKIR